MNIQKGHILETSEDGRFAKIQGIQREVFDNVLLIYPYGYVSNIGTGDSTLALMFYGTGSSTNAFAIPYDVLSQPAAKDDEVIIGNFRSGAKVNFKEDGSIFIETGSTTINILKDGDITITTPLADFSSNVDVGGDLNVQGNTDVVGNVDTLGVYKVNGIQVVSNRGAPIPDAIGVTGAVDPEARAAINAWLAQARPTGHGLIS